MYVYIQTRALTYNFFQFIFVTNRLQISYLNLYFKTLTNEVYRDQCFL